jgi:hypothetical protein
MPPPKSGPPGAGKNDGDRARPARRAPGSGALPDMTPVEPPDMVEPAEEPVTGSGNYDLWADRIAARRAAAGADRTVGSQPDQVAQAEPEL